MQQPNKPLIESNSGMHTDCFSQLWSVHTTPTPRGGGRTVLSLHPRIMLLASSEDSGVVFEPMPFGRGSQTALTLPSIVARFQPPKKALEQCLAGIRPYGETGIHPGDWQLPRLPSHE